MACVYKITRVDGLSYIGITIDFKKRLRTHRKSQRFAAGILSSEILYESDSYEEVANMEPILIEKHNTYYKGLNLTKEGKGLSKGGKFNTFGYTYSDESKKKMSVSAKNRTDRRTGYTHTQEVKDHWSSVRKGKCWGPLKFSHQHVTEILELYASRPHIDGVGERQKGSQHILKYDNAFAKKYAKKYECTSAWILMLLKGEIISWNHLVNKILNTKY